MPTQSSGDAEVTLLFDLVRAIVDMPDDIKIERAIDEMGVLMTLSVNQADMGRIIGREGSTAKAIRTILRVVGMRHQSRINLKIAEPVVGTLSVASLDEDLKNII